MKSHLIRCVMCSLAVLSIVSCGVSVNSLQSGPNADGREIGSKLLFARGTKGLATSTDAEGKFKVSEEDSEFTEYTIWADGARYGFDHTKNVYSSDYPCKENDGNYFFEEFTQCKSSGGLVTILIARAGF